ncbi:MAG: hypothetical protein A2V88_07085 [Elusimicrobia bacterium RBG_16_66_12]|nr:MAG: hypothetical protein A2V88_07085 [Elusimicrobia bacterium RBG_16_66_12]
MTNKVSIVIPIYQNEATIAQVCREVSAVIGAHAGGWAPHFILVNDGSTDRSWEIMQGLQRGRRGGFTLLNFNRNFGQMSALLAGYSHADGDCVISMSADLQDPPEVISLLLSAWRQGHKLVVANRQMRDDGLISDALSNICWKLLRRFAVPGIPEGGFDFFLMDRELRDHFVLDPEQHIFLQGRLLFYGYQPFCVPYERRKRLLGRSQTSLGVRIKYFIDGFAAYSFLPLRIMSAVGILLFIAAVLISGLIAWYVMVHGSRVEGWASLMVVILFLNGMQMLAIGIIGEYLWRNIEETRKRPHYVLRDVLPRSGSDA